MNTQNYLQEANKRRELHKAFYKFFGSYYELSEAWQCSGLDLSKAYPFSQSFDDIPVYNWLEQSINTIEQADTMQCFILVFQLMGSFQAVKCVEVNEVAIYKTEQEAKDDIVNCFDAYGGEENNYHIIPSILTSDTITCEIDEEEYILTLEGYEFKKVPISRAENVEEAYFRNHG